MSKLSGASHSRSANGLSPVPAACEGGCRFFVDDLSKEAAIHHAAGPAITYGKNEVVYRQGEKAAHCYKVVEGAVRVSRVLMDGHRQVLNFVLPGETFGLELSDSYTADAEVVRNALLLRCSRACIMHLTDAETEKRRKMMAMLSDGMSAAQEHVVLLGQQSARERVAMFLLRLAHHARIEDRGMIEVPMGRQDMADYLGLTLETTCRTLTDLKTRGVISIPNRRQIEVRSLTGVQAAAEGDL